jgi:indolepyruvate ferredoxin oxidoreductase beta subunit
MMKDVNFLIVGVGGQGTVLSGDIIAEVGMEAGLDAKKSDVLGLAIRSGSVVSHVRWGKKVNAPMSMRGEVDYLLAFEPLESLRMLEFLKPDSTVIVNEYRIPPVAVTTGQAAYPSEEEVRGLLEQAAAKVYLLDATQKAQDLGNVKTVNILLIGALSSLLEAAPAIWEKVISKYVPERYLEVNLKAFQTGRKLIA